MDWDETLAQLDTVTTVWQAMACWQGDAGSLRHISTGVNAVFRFEMNNIGYYLRITHNGLTDLSIVRSALHFLAHLWQEGAAVCEPIAAQSGEMFVLLPIHTTTEALPSDGFWIASVTREVPGKPLGLEEKNPAAFEAWGNCLGRFHQAARTYKPQPEDRFGGIPLTEAEAKWEQYRSAIPAFDVLALREYEQLYSWYQALLQTANPQDFGLTHQDSRSQNVIWDGRSATMIDFDEPGWGWFVEDIARALGEYWWKEERHLFRDSFLHGYRSVCKLSEYWEASLPFFMRWWALKYYVEWSPYATPKALEEADRPETFRPGDFPWHVRRRFADPAQWE